MNGKQFFNGSTNRKGDLFRQCLKALKDDFFFYISVCNKNYVQHLDVLQSHCLFKINFQCVFSQMFAGWAGESMTKVKPNGFKNDFPCTPPTASPRVLSRETL